MWAVFILNSKKRDKEINFLSFLLLQHLLPVQHLAGQKFSTVAYLDSCKPQKLLSKQASGAFMCERDRTGVYWSIAAPFLCGFLLSQATKCFLSLSITFFDLTPTGDEETWGFVCTSAHSLICFFFKSLVWDSWWEAQRICLRTELGPCWRDANGIHGSKVHLRGWCMTWQAWAALIAHTFSTEGNKLTDSFGFSRKSIKYILCFQICFHHKESRF